MTSEGLPNPAYPASDHTLTRRGTSDPGGNAREKASELFPLRLTATARDLLCVAAVAGFLFFLALGARDLWNPNEPIYGRAVVEMAERGDWRIPTVNGIVFAEKPILYFWLARVSSLIAGSISEFSLRVPSAIAGVVSAMLTYLLVLPYAGRRRALMTVALFATLHQVFWAARSVQMDILVLATTLAVVLPLTRMLDFGLHARKAWILAGIAAGIGFLAKGPVTWILPGMIVFFHAASERKLRQLISWWIVLGGAIAVAVSAPWYLSLWIGGDTAFLHEVLIRQNFSRFVEAWDHANPWWYYATYLLADYAPWSFLLPAAILGGALSSQERKLERLSIIWIASIVLFFSLADSKRAPYILPIAPAVSALAAGVVDRWIARSIMLRRARIAAGAAFAILMILIIAGGLYALLALPQIPIELQKPALAAGVFLTVAGCLLAAGQALFRKAGLVPAGLLMIFTTMYIASSVWILPAADPIKSDRRFSAAMNRELARENGSVVSYRLWDWRAGYAFYADRTITNLDTRAGLQEFWRRNERAYVVVEEKHRLELERLLPDASLVRQQKIGGRIASLYARQSSRDPQSIAETSVSVPDSRSIRLPGAAEPAFVTSPR